MKLAVLFLSLLFASPTFAFLERCESEMQYSALWHHKNATHEQWDQLVVSDFVIKSWTHLVGNNRGEGTVYISSKSTHLTYSYYVVARQYGTEDTCSMDSIDFVEVIH